MKIRKPNLNDGRAMIPRDFHLPNNIRVDESLEMHKNAAEM
jgi:hypothetical protein